MAARAQRRNARFAGVVAEHARVLLLLLATSGVQATEGGARLYIAGDSTASDYPPERAPQAGWGQALPWFMADEVQVLNRAVSGRSTRSYIDEGKWQALVDELQRGDIVLISFGHNDSRDDAVERYAAADGAYRDNLLRFVADVRSKGATPIILSPAARRLWEGPAMVETHGLYAYNAMIAASSAGVDFIDLANGSLAYFETLGREGTKQDFLWLSPEDGNERFPDGVEDNTHFTALGACGVARVVATSLLALDTGAGLVEARRIGGDAPVDPGERPQSVQDCAQALER